MKNRVLFILHMPPPVHGAAVVGKQIKESELINHEFDACYINLSTSVNLKEVGRWSLFKIISLFTLQVKLIKILLSKDFDLCYMTLTAKGPGFYKDCFIVLILKIFRMRIAFHFHNKGVSSTKLIGLDHLLYKWTFNNTKCILLSKHLFSDIERYVNPKNVFYCANGIPEVNLLRYSLPVNPCTPCRLLFLSNMMEEKGVWVLLEACKILKKRELSFECHFVGDWSDIREEHLISQVQNHNLQQNTFAHGKKYYEDKFSYLSSSNIFILPTYYPNECFPLVLLEAMQFGLPIISTPEGGIRDIVIDGETGFIVPQRDAIALADKIEFLIKHPKLRKQMGDLGRKHYESCFTLKTFEKNFANILTSAIEQTEIIC